MPSHPYVAPPTPETLQLRDAAWHEQSIAQALGHWDGQSDLWVFGYGSLIWRPEFDYLEARPGTVQGYHRALCMWSRVNRGTPEHPGLVFSMDHGGQCDGRAYRIAARRIPDTMRALWRREMPSGAYIPRWLPCETPGGSLSALAFTMDRKDPSYVPGLSIEQILHIVRTSHGRYGPCSEYVLQTAQALEAAGILDPQLATIARALRASPEIL